MCRKSVHTEHDPKPVRGVLHDGKGSSDHSGTPDGPRPGQDLPSRLHRELEMACLCQDRHPPDLKSGTSPEIAVGDPRILSFHFNELALAGGLGFEPRLTESESAVLPLNYPPIGKSNQIRSGMDQASQAGPATAADRRRPTQRAHIYGIPRRFPSGVGEGARQASCAAAPGRRLERPCAKTARLIA